MDDNDDDDGGNEDDTELDRDGVEPIDGDDCKGGVGADIISDPDIASTAPSNTSSCRTSGIDAAEFERG